MIARRSYDVLERIEKLPEDKNGNIDGEAFAGWVARVRKKLEELNRSRVGDSLIGKIIARATYSKTEEWPDVDLASCVERLANDSLISGFSTQVVNLRGITSRGPTDGGEKERQLADRYKELADRIRRHSSRLAGAFSQVSEGYLREAKRHDEDAERVRWGQ